MMSAFQPERFPAAFCIVKQKTLSLISNWQTERLFFCLQCNAKYGWQTNADCNDFIASSIHL